MTKFSVFENIKILLFYFVWGGLNCKSEATLYLIFEWCLANTGIKTRWLNNRPMLLLTYFILDLGS